jgi:peptidoglycan/LPS O-acetylase OafA/YrhL
MNRSILLDLLRIFAIGLVFVAHFGQFLGASTGGFFGVKNFYYVSLGGVGVSIFLILSGVLAGLGDANKQTRYLTYIVKKCLRIYPLYWISVPLSILGYVAGSWLLDGDIPKLSPNGLLIDITGSVTGFYSWMGLWGGPYNSPSWFIGLIMVMYAIFPPLVYAMKRWPHLSILVLFVISAYARYYVGQHGVPFVDQGFFEGIKSWFFRKYGFMPGRPGDWFPLCRVFEFGLGMYIALMLPKGFWFKLDLPFKRIIIFLSDIAFPLFLIHLPFMFLVHFFEKEMGLPLALAITVFMAVLVLASYAVNKLDQLIPRKWITQKLGL